MVAPSGERNRLRVIPTFLLVLLMRSLMQGLTLVHFSAQLEPCLTHKSTLHTPYHPLYTGHTNPMRPPYPKKTLKLS